MSLAAQNEPRRTTMLSSASRSTRIVRLIALSPEPHSPVTFLTVDTVPSVLPCNNADPIQAVYEQAFPATDLLLFAPAEAASSPPEQPMPASEPAQTHAAPSRTPHSPLAVSIDPSSLDSSLEAPTPLLSRPAPRLPSPPRNRVVEPTLWKLACRTRVDHV